MHICDEQTEFLIWLFFKVSFITITITIICYYNPMSAVNADSFLLELYVLHLCILLFLMLNK